MKSGYKIMMMAAGALCAAHATYGAVTSPSTKLRLMRQEAVSRSDEEPPFTPLLLLVDDASVEEELREMGVVIFNSRDNILLACVPSDKVNDVLDHPGLIGAETNGKINTMLDEARAFCGADIVQQGLDGLPGGYDGSGVVVGFSDIGFDARHIAFKDRLSSIYNYDAYYGVRQAAETADEIAAWTTDDAYNFHATHVGNILGGNYRGNPYYGVATGAEMVATTSRLTDVGILAGVEDIIAYARGRGKRAVVNLSIGSHLGAHDGTSLVCRYLAACAREAVICLSAANTGETDCYAMAEVDDPEKIYRLTVNSLSTWDGFQVYGMTEFWSDTSSPFDFRIEVWDKDMGEVVFATDWTGDENPLLYLTPDEYPEWGELMDGYVWAECGESPLNGRYCTSVLYNTSTVAAAANSDGRWSRYYTSLAFKARKDVDRRVRVDVYADGAQSFIGYADAASAPTLSSAGSISELCTADGVIAVGNCVSRSVVPSLAFGSYDYDIPTDRIAESSAYSNIPTVARLPHFSAPGMYVVSAMSSEFLDITDSFNIYLAAEASTGGRSYYWVPMSGTSMSSPLAAGIIAQWLQADPTLTTERIIDIARSTARTDFDDIGNPRWGAGCIDAKTGLESILKASAPEIEKEDGNEICDVYTLQGVRLLSAPRSDLPRLLAPGIYVCGRRLIHITARASGK